ncbi:hypothetical protein [Jannaschia sp. R86511]|uniref:hypothetical protein n=1 Tax=Jannaschia sp. R86511 TaxID=3093853 RepID=UPI0036D246DB
MTDDGWHRAAAAAARRLRSERGLDDRCVVTASFRGPVVCFGDLHLPVGPGTDVAAPEDLHAVLDEAVAWERAAGPGRWLPRDQETVDRLWTEATASVPLYRLAGQLLAADLERTTRQSLTWTVTVTASSEPQYLPAAVPRPPLPTIGVELAFGPDGGGGYSVPVLEPLTLTEAVSELLYVGEDDIIEELWGRWPLCASHVAELVLDEQEGTPVWACPVDQRIWSPVGRLGPGHIQRD